jgi:hypothetical protein
LIELDRPRRSGRILGRVRRWALAWGRRMVQRRIERELAAYRHPPEIGFGASSHGAPHGPPQVFRSLIQVNFYPRERG